MLIEIHKKIGKFLCSWKKLQYTPVLHIPLVTLLSCVKTQNPILFDTWGQWVYTSVTGYKFGQLLCSQIKITVELVLNIPPVTLLSTFKTQIISLLESGYILMSLGTSLGNFCVAKTYLM